DRPALEILAGSLAEMGVRPAGMTRSARLLTRDRDAWLMRLRSAERSPSSISAYRYAINDLLSWAHQHDGTGDLSPPLPAAAQVHELGEPPQRAAGRVPRAAGAPQAAAGERLAHPRGVRQD